MNLRATSGSFCMKGPPYMIAAVISFGAMTSVVMRRTALPSVTATAEAANDIPVEFPEAAAREAEHAKAAPLGDRLDLRKVPLVTIDGEDARDFDDAVFAEPDADHPGGWRLLVAIADVAWYVRPDKPLDRAAYRRGTSVYFPDRVVPMLPEALSNHWCSLVPHEDRPVLAAEMWIDAEGHLKRHRFHRAMMRSAAIAMACSPDEQKRLMVTAETSTGKPARSEAMRATFIPCSASGMAQPRMTSSISLGSSCGTRSSAPLIATAASSSGRVARSVPL